MTQDGTPKDDIKVPEGDVGKHIKGDFEDGKDLVVTIARAMGEEQVLRPSALLGSSNPVPQAVSFKKAPRN